MDIKFKDFKKGNEDGQKPFIRNNILELLPIENKCVNCDKIFDFPQELSEHVQQFHSKANAFKCGDCNVLLMNMICLSHHMQNHKDSQKKYVCNFCSKELICNDELKLHLKTHAGDNSKSSNDSKMKKHVCEYCPKSFDRIFNLKRHLRVHTGERPFSCTLCKKAYKEKCDLTNHQKFHILEKKLKGVLKGRLRTRAGERPYSCSLCEKSYKEMRHLTRHQKIHEQKSEKSKNDLNSSKVNKRKRSSPTQSEVNNHKSDLRQWSSSKNNVEKIINKLDIKEELYSDSDSLDDVEVKNLIEICKTEYIYDEDIVYSAERLEENYHAKDYQHTQTIEEDTVTVTV